MIEAIDVTNSQVVWTASVADYIGSNPETDSMTIAEGTLFVPVGDTLVAFR